MIQKESKIQTNKLKVNKYRMRVYPVII